MSELEWEISVLSLGLLLKLEELLWKAGDRQGRSSGASTCLHAEGPAKWTTVQILSALATLCCLAQRIH